MMNRINLIFVLGITSGTLLPQVDYETEIQPTFNSNCIGCHGGSGGLTLTSYTTLMAGDSDHGPVITPYDGENSVLVQKLGSNPPFGSRMPRDNPSYFDNHPEELQTIKDWIDAGALPPATVAVAEDNNTNLTYFTIFPNFPNPFNPRTIISYNLPKQSQVTITIHDLLGRKVKTLLKEVQGPGLKSVTWDATNDTGQLVSAGVYLYRIQAGNFIETRKMVLLN